MNKKRKSRKRPVHDAHSEARSSLNRKKSGNRENIREDKYRLLADIVLQSGDAVTAWDLEGSIIAWNRGAEKMYGYSEAEALTMKISSIIPEDRREEGVALLNTIKTAKAAGSLQTTRITREGRIIDVWLTVTKLVDKEGNITGISTIERDVTGHSRLLEEIETSLALAEKYANDIDHLVAERTASLIALNIADRITNPVVVIGMLCRRMLDGKKVNQDEQKDMEVILGECEKLEQIVREFSSLIERKKSLFHYEDLNGLMGEALVLVRAQAELKGVALIADLSETPLMMNMNRNVLRTAFFYILKNALEATPAGGTIKTVTREKTDSITVDITDTGCGIPEKHINRVFDNFFTTKANGVGMGLPFVKHIIEEHYGNIKVESREECGTIFSITFPLRWLKLADGVLLMDKPMLPAVKGEREYPLQADPGTGKSGDDTRH